MLVPNSSEDNTHFKDRDPQTNQKHAASQNDLSLSETCNYAMKTLALATLT